MCKFAPLCRFSRDFLQANVGFGYMGEYVGVKVMLRGEFYADSTALSGDFRYSEPFSFLFTVNSDSNNLPLYKTKRCFLTYIRTSKLIPKVEANLMS